MAPREKASTRRSSREDADDFSIYVHRDFTRSDHIKFAIRSYADAGALSETQIASLAADHGLPLDTARTLSRELGFALDIETDVSLVRISRSVVQRRLRDRRNLDRPVHNKLSAEQADALFRSLSLPVRVKRDATQSTAATVASETASPVSYVDLDTARRALEPDDRRTERDDRRLLVVECCCYAALDAGWSVTYTTASRSKRGIMAPDAETEVDTDRRGRLVRLIQNVIRLVIRNNDDMSGHTLKDDLERVNVRFRMRGDL